MHKIFAFFTLMVAASAAPADHQATSFVSFNDNHNSVHHIQSAPASFKYAAPAPFKYAAPAAPVYATPAVAKVSIPVVAKFSAPAASSYYSAPASKYTASVAPVYSSPAFTKVAIPTVTKQVIAPVTKYSAASAYAPKEEEYGPAQYQFAYVIEDPHTGDYHSQQEQRDGHHVVGQYSLHEADGTVRIVKYSDEGHGFNAVVEKQGHPTEAPAYKKIVPATPQQFAHHY